MEKRLFELHTKGRSNRYDARATFLDGKVVVLCGSKLAPKTSKSPLSRTIAAIRNNFDIVGEDRILKVNVEFSNPSLAAQFVTANISNGLRVWKLNDGSTLNSLFKKAIE